MMPATLSFSRYAGSLPESQTLAITARAKQMKADGIDVAPFAAGEPDFDTPKHVKEAGLTAIREGRTRYAPAAGIPALREAVAEKFCANGLRGCTPDRTLVCAGAKGVLFQALEALLQEGDEVLVPTPAWLSYPQMIHAVGGRTVFVRTDPASRYVIDPERVRAAVTPRTRAIILNSPGNPTGAVQPDEVQAAIGRIAVEHDLLVISDEIYEYMTYAPATFTSFAAAAPEAADLTLLVNGVSKAYAMTGWRIGYGGGPKDLMVRMARLQSHASSGTPEICQRAALAALTGPQDDLHRMQAAFAKRRQVICDELAKIDGVTCPLPDGAFYVFPDVSAFLGRRFEGKPIEDVSTLAELVLVHARAAIVPGSVFEAPYALRFSYACSEADIREGVGRVADFLGSLEG